MQLNNNGVIQVRKVVFLSATVQSVPYTTFSLYFLRERLKLDFWPKIVL